MPDWRSTGRDAGGRREGVGGAEAREGACLGEELGGEHGPHAGQAADEGGVRVAGEQRLELAVERGEPGAGRQRLGGELLDEARGHALAGTATVCSRAAASAFVGQRLDMGHTAGGLEVADEAPGARGAQLGRRDVAAQEMLRALGGQVEEALQAGEDADEEVVLAAEPLGLGVDQVAAAADEQPQLEVELGGRLDRPQVAADAHLVGDDPRVARVGLVLAAHRALAGAVDGQARHVDEREAGLRQHRLREAGDAADDVEPDAHRSAERRELVDERGDGRRPVLQPAVEPHDALRIDGRDPMHLLGDVDSDADLHAPSEKLVLLRHLARAVVALHSDDPQSLISGRGELAAPGDLPPEPSRAASMKTIPTPPPQRDPGMPGSRCQALLAQQLNGRAGMTAWHRHHMCERYGLMNIIVLGETLLAAVVAIRAAIEHGPLTGELAIVALSAMVTAFALWWLYFSDEEHLGSGDRNRAFVWGYGHFLIFAAGASAGAGFAVQVDVLTEHAYLTRRTADLAVAIPVALYMFGLWLVRDRYCLHGHARSTLLVGAALALATPLLPHALPGLAALAVLAALARITSPGGRPGSRRADRIVTARIIIDTDPGQDDAVAILLALASPEIEVLGITTVAGNVPLPLTTKNALKVVELAGRPEVAVHAGAAAPLVRKLVTAEAVHGKSGLDGPDLPEPAAAPRDAHAVDFIVETLRREPPGTVTLATLGPLTNVALAFAKAPDVVPRVARLVGMGGAWSRGQHHAGGGVQHPGRPARGAGGDARGRAGGAAPARRHPQVPDPRRPGGGLPRARHARGRGHRGDARILRALRPAEVRH